MRNFFVIGHRGMGPTSALHESAFSDGILPENSIAALKYAFSVGADGVEIDVHKTLDDQVAVIHDGDLNKKVFHPDKIGKDLGRVREHTLEELEQYDIGGGHKIPSLTDVLDLIVEENQLRMAEGKPSLIIDIELKGEDVVDATYRDISEYINSGKLSVDDFIFNSFYWDRLEHIKLYEPDFKVVPAIRTIDLFGVDNVQMPGFIVDEDAQYQPEGMAAIQKFHDEVGCYAFDCIIFDLRPEFVDYCEHNNIGLLTSTSKEAIKADNIKEQLALMVDAADRLPMVCFRADNTTETHEILQEIIEEKSLTQANTHKPKYPKFRI